jgi:hypothetical protein
MTEALLRGERLETPIGNFHRDQNGSNCVTHVLEGSDGKPARRLVHRRPAVHYNPNPVDTIALAMAAWARGEGRIWNVMRHSGRKKDVARVVYSGTEEKARERYRKLSDALRQGWVELINSDGCQQRSEGTIR